MIQGAVKCEKKIDKSSVRIPPGDGVFNGGKSIRFCVFTTNSFFFAFIRIKRIFIFTFIVFQVVLFLFWEVSEYFISFDVNENE